MRVNSYPFSQHQRKYAISGSSIYLFPGYKLGAFTVSPSNLPPSSSLSNVNSAVNINNLTSYHLPPSPNSYNALLLYSTFSPPSITSLQSPKTQGQIRTEMESPSSSLSSLLCQESSSILLAEDELDGDEEDPSLATLFTSNGFPDSEDEYVQLLLQREKSHFSVLHSQTFNSGNLSKIARLDAIDYILHIIPRMGFQFQTAYLAVTYLDRFLALRTVDSERAWASELLSLGCVSVAAKFQETNVPGLSLFQHGNIRFEIKAIQRMELLILSTLEWKMDSITPFSFLPYFINNLISEAPQAITLNKIVQLILAFMKDRSLMDYYPSAIALSAVLMSLDDNFTRNALYSKINALASNRFLDNDYVSNCYLIMQKLERKQTKILQLSASPDLSPIKSTQMGSFQNSSATYSISSKRRRLFFNGNFDNNEAESDKRQHKLHDI